MKPDRGVGVWGEGFSVLITEPVVWLREDAGKLLTVGLCGSGPAPRR